MSHAAVLTENQVRGQDESEIDLGENDRCFLSMNTEWNGLLKSELCRVLAEVGCSPALFVHERLELETLMAELSGVFLNLPRSQVESQIELALQRLVISLGFDRGSLAELRLRLAGEIFTNALARKRAAEALSAKEQSLRQSRENLRKLAAKLLHAQEEERRRIAREMHDDWTQRLALLGIAIANVEKHLEAPEIALPLLSTMQERASVELSEDVHDLSRRACTRPSLMNLGLVEAAAIRGAVAVSLAGNGSRLITTRKRFRPPWREGVCPLHLPRSSRSLAQSR